MIRRSPIHRLLALLCAVALLSAQVFGLVRGYVCDCSGQQELTAQDHCHGPHDGDCHRDEDPGHQHEEGDGSGDRRDHAQVRDEVDSRLVQSSVEAPGLVPVLIAIFEGETHRSAPVFLRAASNEVPADTGPPTGVAVARTTVLLI